MVVATVTYIAGKKPLAIRTPGKIDVAITIGEDKLAVHHCADLLAGEVDDADGAAVLEIGYLLTVRTILWLERGLVLIRQLFFLKVSGIGKLLLVLVLNSGLIDVPAAATLRGIGNAAAVR